MILGQCPEGGSIHRCRQLSVCPGTVPAVRGADGREVRNMTSRMDLSITEWDARRRLAKPFIKWAGGKQRFVLEYGARLQVQPGAQYLEPFLGGGSVFFHLASKSIGPLSARLGDRNLHLINTFIAVRDEPERVIEGLQILQAGYAAATDKAAFYYALRDQHNAEHPRTNPARFIFLMRACWNALYRVNQRGLFNVPYGAPKTDQIAPSPDAILNASAALYSAQIRACGWQDTIAMANPGDFVFLDPPYYSDVINDEAKYDRKPFTREDHWLLIDHLADLRARGIDFVLTNSAEPELVAAYTARGFAVEYMSVPRSINSNTEKRHAVPEIVVTPGDGSFDSGRQGVLLDLHLAAYRQRAARETKLDLGADAATEVDGLARDTKEDE